MHLPRNLRAISLERTMRVYRTTSAVMLEHERQSYVLPETNLDMLLAVNICMNTCYE